MNRHMIAAGLSAICLASFTGTPALAQAIVDPGTVTVFDQPDGATVANTCTGAATDCDGGGVGVRDLEISAVLGAGLNQRDIITVSLVKPFIVSDAEGAGIVLDAQVNGVASWRGTLLALGTSLLGRLRGSQAFVFILAELVDVTDPTEASAGSTVVLSSSCAPAATGIEINLPLLPNIGVTGCRTEERFNKFPFNFKTKVMTGRSYELRLKTTCATFSGAGDFPIICTFRPIPPEITGVIADAIDTLGIDLAPIIPADDGFVRWDTFNIAIDENLSDRIGETRDGVAETIRLLHVPQGRRSSSIYDDVCGDGTCDFPER